MAVEGYRATRIAAVAAGVMGCAVGCASMKQPGPQWTSVSLRVDVYAKELDLLIPETTHWEGAFRTNIFALSFISVATGGYILEVENLTRFPLEFEWRRSVIVDATGWTHPLIHPNAATDDPCGSHTDLPIIIAPHAKRRVLLASRSAFCPSELPFKPGVDPVELFRRVPASEQDELVEGLLLVFTFRGEELMYRFEATLKAGGSPGDQDASEQLSPVREAPN